MLGAPVISASELAYLQSVYPALHFRPLSSQMNQALLFYLKGYPAAKAASMAGMNSASALHRYLNSDEGQAVLEFVRDQHFEQIAVTRELLNKMLFEAHSKAANATEEVMAIKELGKLNDLYPGARTQIDITNIRNIENIKQLQTVPADELLKMSSPQLQQLLSMPVPIEGEFTEVLTPEEEERRRLNKELDI